MNTYDHERSTKQTAVFDKYGVFFAFSSEQYQERRKAGVTYSSMGAGMLTPKGTGGAVIDALEAINEDINAKIRENNTVKEIVFYELANRECQIVGSYEDAIEPLADIGINKAEIVTYWREYLNYCVENDLF